MHRPSIFINNATYTIRFEKVFPNFETWKTALLQRGLDEADVEEGVYQFLHDAYGTLYVKWRTELQAATLISGIFASKWRQYKNRKLLFDAKIDELTGGKVQYGQNEPVMGDDGSVSYDTSNIVTNSSYADIYPQLLSKTNLIDPLLLLVEEFIADISLLIQPNDNWAYPTGGDFDAD